MKLALMCAVKSMGARRFSDDVREIAGLGFGEQSSPPESSSEEEWAALLWNVKQVNV